MSEPLQVNNENWRSPVDLKNLGSLNMFFTLVAIPLVLLIKDLRFLKLVEAIINCDIFLILYLSILIAFWECTYA